MVAEQFLFDEEYVIAKCDATIRFVSGNGSISFKKDEKYYINQYHYKEMGHTHYLDICSNRYNSCLFSLGNEGVGERYNIDEYFYSKREINRGINLDKLLTE